MLGCGVVTAFFWQRRRAGVLGQSLERNAEPFLNFGTDVEKMSLLGYLGSDLALEVASLTLVAA